MTPVIIAIATVIALGTILTIVVRRRTKTVSITPHSDTADTSVEAVTTATVQAAPAEVMADPDGPTFMPRIPRKDLSPGNRRAAQAA